MDIRSKTESFNTLGDFFRVFSGKHEYLQALPRNAALKIPEFRNVIEKTKQHNPWFTGENIMYAIAALADTLTIENIEKWIEPYRDKMEAMENQRNIGVIMAGNVPLVGFHDFICVLMSGQRFNGKLSAGDPYLLKAVASVLEAITPEFGDRIQFTDTKLENPEAIIATGSNNTSRYFEYYFGKYPNIIRKNRNGVAILTGGESREELEALGEDIFRYFGLGCRNVSRLFISEGFDLDRLFDAWQLFADLARHNKYMNNYNYYRSVYLLDQKKFLTNDFLILREEESFVSPVGVLNYEFFRDMSSLREKLDINRDNIQCIVSAQRNIPGSVYPGNTQKPELWDYADGVDTMAFLLSLE